MSGIVEIPIAVKKQFLVLIPPGVLCICLIHRKKAVSPCYLSSGQLNLKNWRCITPQCYDAKLD